MRIALLVTVFALWRTCGRLDAVQAVADDAAYQADRNERAIRDLTAQVEELESTR